MERHIDLEQRAAEDLKDILLESGMLEVEVARADTFEEVGLLTSDKGIVVKLASGDEFQITVVQTA